MIGSGPVGIFPARARYNNKFVENLSHALEHCGSTVVEVERLHVLRAPAISCLILNWPENSLNDVQGFVRKLKGISRVVLSVLRMRLSGRKVLWLIHNLDPRDADLDKKRLWRIFSFVIMLLVSGYATLSPSTLADVRRRWPLVSRKPSTHIWYPLYDVTVDKASARQAVVSQYGLDGTETLIGYAGLIRPYKGLENLIEAFRETGDPRYRLMICGNPQDAAYSQRISDMAAGDRRIILDFRELPLAEFDTRVSALDVFCAPFNTYLHSGSLLHALSAGTPVLTPATSFSRDLLQYMGEDWVTLYGGALTGALILSAASAGRHTETPAPAYPDVRENAAEFVGFLQKL